MLKNWLFSFLSRYTFRYPRSLVYMLQTSEYHIREYLAWYHRTKDFSHVEQRTQLVKTPKALLLLAIAWFFVFLLLGATFFALWTGTAPLNYIWFLLIVFLSPHLLAYGILIPLLIASVLIQRPIEFCILKNARERLKAHKATKIAVAGSFGKTTMREILKTVLAEGKKVAAPPHSYNTPLGISQFVKTLDGDEDILIFEFGEYHPGDVRKLCHLVQPNIGVITGINEAHLEKFKSLERTVATIYELADYLNGNPVYVNGENAHARNNVRPGNILYDREHVGDWNIENQKTGLGGTTCTLTKSGARLELQSALLGLHQIGPLAAACDIALCFGLSPEQIKSGISKTTPFGHRLEPKIDSTGVITLDDSYNGNPDGVKAVIEFLALLAGHKRWYVTPGLVEMGARTKDVHREIGRQLANAGIEKVILIKNSVSAYIEEGLKGANYTGDILWFDDALACFAALPHLTAKGDVVLLQNDWPDQYQ